MNLYFDIGNTNIKLNFNFNGQEYYERYITKEKYSIKKFYSKFPKIIKENKIENIIICSVVPKKTSLVSKIVKKYFKIVPWIIGFPMEIPISIEIDSPKKVGTDLIALSTYASSIYSDAIIINMGTATTIISVINKKLGGVIIAAGLMTQMESLINNASQLSKVNLKKQKNPIGKNTRDSLSLGVLHGHAEMIKGLVNNINPLTKVIISGGLSMEMKELLPDYEFIKEATIEGMKVLWNFNKKNRLLPINNYLK